MSELRSKKSVRKEKEKKAHPPVLKCIAKKQDQWNELFDYITRRKLAYEIGEDGDSLAITFTIDDEEHNVNLDFSDDSGIMGYLDGEPEMFETETLKKIVQGFVKRFSHGDDGDHHAQVLGESADYVEKESDPEDNKLLMAELQNFRVMFGEDRVKTHSIFSMKQMEIQLLVQPLDFIRKATAQAWGVDPEKEIIIRIDINYDEYPRNSSPPKLEVIQFENGMKKKIKLGVQLGNLLALFSKFHWKEVSDVNHKTEQLSEQEKESLGTGILSVKAPVVNSALHDKLVSMEFDSGSVENVLTWVDNEKDALKLLQSDDMKCFEANPKYKAPERKVEPQYDFSVQNKGITKPEPISPSNNNNNKKESTSRSFMGKSTKDDGKKKKENDKKTAKEDSKTTPKSPLSNSKKKAARIDTLFADKDGKNGFLKTEVDSEKFQCSTRFGYLCMLMAYTQRRISTLNNFCVICDKPHVFTSGSMLKPAVCSREICCWGFQQLGVGSDAAEEIATEAEVVDLLVSMAKVGVKSANRRELIFDPFPQICDPDNKDVMVLSPQNKDWNLLQKLIDSIPSVQQMTQAEDFVSMKENMEGKHGKYAFPMLQWIISSNRSHIVQLNSSVLVKGMCTPFQYLLLSDSPEKEEVFRKHKKEHGTIFAFHGSAIENWHGILRKGLINASGTKWMSCGAAYGNGIYLSPAAATSFGYCGGGGGYGQPTTQLEKTEKTRYLDCNRPMTCIAICEVVNKDINRNGDIWVHPHQDMVSTRFFFVFPEQKTGGAHSCRTDKPELEKELLAALAFYQ
jgi:hypothetical protein